MATIPKAHRQQQIDIQVEKSYPAQTNKSTFTSKDRERPLATTTSDSTAPKGSLGVRSASEALTLLRSKLEKLKELIDPPFNQLTNKTDNIESSTQDGIGSNKQRPAVVGSQKANNPEVKRTDQEANALTTQFEQQSLGIWKVDRWPSWYENNGFY